MKTLKFARRDGETGVSSAPILNVASAIYEKEGGKRFLNGNLF
jgi:hypothetical protein